MTQNTHNPEYYAQQVVKDGFCVIENLFSRTTLGLWAQAFDPLLRDYINSGGSELQRGPSRYYVTLPFEGEFADPSIIENDLILRIVEILVGSDFVMCQLATDTPLLGSDYQDVHRDTPPLFPESGQETPAFRLAINFPLVDVTGENGPIEIASGTHMLPKAEALRILESGEVKLEPILMRCGDVMIRDVRGLHRGSPNHTNIPRPMVVLGYSRKWLLRPEVSIEIPRNTFLNLSSRAKHMLRFNPIVDEINRNPKKESYDTFAY